MADEFPEAFDRFEDDVDVDELEDFTGLYFAFQNWGLEKATMTDKQVKALASEGKSRHNIKPEINGKTLFEFNRTYTRTDKKTGKKTSREVTVQVWRDKKGKYTSLKKKDV